MADSLPFVVWTDNLENPTMRLVLLRGASVAANVWTFEMIVRTDAMGVPVWQAENLDWARMVTILNGVFPVATA
jgi:hypothetical protein